MALSDDLVKEFAKVVAPPERDPNRERTMYGTVRIVNGVTYIQFDGATVTTPVTNTVEVSDGDRVLALLKDRKAIITGNVTTPIAKGSATFFSDTQPSGENRKLGDIWFDTGHGNAMYRWNGLSWEAAKFDYQALNVAQLSAISSNLGTITAGHINAQNVEITNLNADNITVGTINGQRIADGAINSDKLSQELNEAIDNTVADTQVLYALGTSSSTAPASGWSETAPDWEEGKYMWQQTVITHTDGTVETKPATCISGAAGQAGEDASILRIDSSKGTVFKNSNFGTTFTVVIWKGPREIKDISALRSVYGNGAYLEWKWKRPTDDDFRVISASDSRISRNGFQFDISPDDVDEKIVFQCDLIV